MSPEIDWEAVKSNLCLLTDETLKEIIEAGKEETQLRRKARLAAKLIANGIPILPIKGVTPERLAAARKEMHLR